MPRGRPLVSAVVLNRDGATFLEALFASLHAYNSWNPLEIIVIDHASSDDSLDVARRWSKWLPIDVVARDTNDSFSYANNRAAERVGGEILLLVNNDIVLTEDVIPRMVAAVEATGGLIGARQFENGPPDAAGRRRWHHIGVRYSWNPRLRLLMPRNAIPAPGDETLAASPCRMPAVTASLMMCRRADYLAVGGMSEAYFYGFEDVDLCCKFLSRLGHPVICLNDITALHSAGSTRRRSASARRRRELYRANIRTLDERFGFWLWRDLGTAWLGDDGSLRGLAPGLAALGGPLDLGLRAALAGFARGGWSVAHRVHARSLDLTGIDVVVVADPAIDLDRVRRRDILLCWVGWACNAVEDWTARPDLSAFDLLVAADDAAAERLRGAGAPAVLLMAMDGMHQALLRALVGRRRDTYRFAVLAAGRREQARGLVQALAAAGQTAWPARADVPWDIDPADVVVATGGTTPAVRSRLVLPCPTEADVAVAALSLLRAAQAAAQALARGPLDQALPDRSLELLTR